MPSPSMRSILLLALAALTLGACSALPGFLGAKALGFDNQAQPDPDFGFATFGPQMRDLEYGREFYWAYHDGDGIRYDQRVNSRWELRREGRLLGRFVKDETISQTESAGPGIDYIRQSFQHVQRTREDPRTRWNGVYQDDLADGTYTVTRIIRADAEHGGDRTFEATFEVRGGEFVPYDGDTPRPRGKDDPEVYYPFPKVSG